MEKKKKEYFFQYPLKQGIPLPVFSHFVEKLSRHCNTIKGGFVLYNGIEYREIFISTNRSDFRSFLQKVIAKKKKFQKWTLPDSMFKEFESMDDSIAYFLSEKHFNPPHYWNIYLLFQKKEERTDSILCREESTLFEEKEEKEEKKNKKYYYLLPFKRSTPLLDISLFLKRLHTHCTMITGVTVVDDGVEYGQSFICTERSDFRPFLQELIGKYRKFKKWSYADRMLKEFESLDDSIAYFLAQKYFVPPNYWDIFYFFGKKNNFPLFPL